MLTGGLLLLFRLFLPWFRAFFHGTRISLIQIIGMLLRGHSPRLIVDAMIILRSEGNREITPHGLETVYTVNRHMITDVDSLVQFARDAPEGYL